MFLKPLGSWRAVADAARTTVSKPEGDKEPSALWKKKMLLAEHSPIRQLIFRWKWSNLPYWVSVHFVRHKIGIEHFVSTQRTDRTGVARDEMPQGTLVKHECLANAQTIINISRKRLCRKASPETRHTWNVFLHDLKKSEPVLASVCVPECIYRGFCPELDSCGFYKSKTYKQTLEQYRKVV